MNVLPHLAAKRCGLLWLAVLFVVCTTDALAQDDDYQMPPPSLARLVDAPATPAVSFSPDRAHMLLMEQSSLPSIAELAEPELRLAGIRMNPRNNGPSRTRSYNGLVIRTLDGSVERPVTGLPDGARIRNTRWAPDGQHIAFTVDGHDRIDLYVADVATGEARRLVDAAINDASYGAPFAWVSDSRTLIARTVPMDRGLPPEVLLAPSGPVVQENVGKAAPARTYQDLLKNPHDEDVFTYHMTTQLVRVSLDGATKHLGDPRLVTRVSPSPDGAYLLVESIHEPYSYLVPAYRFPRRIDVLDLDGNLVREIDDLPLAESVPTAFGSVPTGIRSINWRADADATLYWVEALDEGNARNQADYRDQVYMLKAPFDAGPMPLVKLPLRYGGITWGTENLALVSESWRATRTRRLYAIDPSQPAEPRLIFDLSYEDRYNDPGFPLTRPTATGTSVLLTPDDGASLFLTGTGASPEGNRPFLRKMNLATGETEELFRSEAPYYERPVLLLDAEALTLITRRESNTEPPNYYQRDLDGGTMAAVTQFPHPYPELADIQKESVSYEREDGIPLNATLYLPAGYDAERDGPLPAFVWAYPREFKSASAAGQRTGSPYQFKRVSYSGAVPYVTQGYAVIDNASMPVVGEGEAEPNDTFREQLVMNAKAAIDEGVRRGVVDPERVAIGGHSYGAFMTANLLAHSDLFRAGIARSGAYNRTLTPFGFQAEERLFWEAPEIYFYMSPFMHAEKVNEPLLMIHGEADNNSGTFPLQSRRFYNAIKGLGGTARLVMLPHESHGYRARESVLHVLWETNRWLETYVKNASPREEMTLEKPTGR
ncbi:MAG: S9 family peptidase [Rhodothermales bacterium]